MAKRRESGFDVVAAWPWPVVLGLGLLAFIGIGWLWVSSSNPFFGPFNCSAMKSRHTLTSGAPAADTALSRGLSTPE